MPCRRALFCTVALLSCLACGKTGSRETRPAEVLYRVSGAGGTRFRLATTADGCDDAVGIRSRNAEHEFGDRVFTAPYFFILENAFQPVQAAFIVPDDEIDPIRVDLFLGLDLRRSLEIMPGECGIVGTGAPETDAQGREVRMELCGSTISFPPGSSCADIVDDFVGFFLSVGDPSATNISTCSARPIAEACRTPATLFVEDAEDEITAVFDTLGGENPDARLRAELYVDGRLVDAQNGRRNVKIQSQL